MRAGDAFAVRAQIERAGTLLIEVERRSPDWPVKLFYLLQDELGSSGPAGALVKDGKRAIAARDQRALDAVNQRLVGLLPKDRQATIIGVNKWKP